MSHLYGAILKPSHTDRFTDWWTSSLQDTLVSRSLPQASEPVKTIHDTSGLGLQTEFDFFALDSVSSRMSKGISPSDSAKSLENWKALVTRRRGEYSLRVKSARLTSASACSSWPTATSQDGKQGGITPFQAKGGNHTNLLHVAAIKEEQKNWPTIRASEYKDVGPVGSKSHDHMLGKHYLCAVVTQEAANWPTPCAMEAEKAGLFDKGQMGQSLSAMANRGELGQAAPANPSTHGSRQGLSDQSLQNWQTFAHGTHNRGETPHRQVVRALVHGEKVQTQMLTVDQVFAEEIKGTNKLWPTITAHTPDMESNGPNGHAGTYLAGAVQKQWATPNAFCFQPPENTEQWTKRAEFQQTEKGVNLHKPIQTQVLHEVEKQWGTPTARDHKSGRGNEEREYKELTPMVERTQSGKLNPRWVETLMGLPVGWTMPSCKSPVTIELTNCASSATESCQPPLNELLES